MQELANFSNSMVLGNAYIIELSMQIINYELQIEHENYSSEQNYIEHIANKLEIDKSKVK